MGNTSQKLESFLTTVDEVNTGLMDKLKTVLRGKGMSLIRMIMAMPELLRSTIRV